MEGKEFRRVSRRKMKKKAEINKFKTSKKIKRSCNIKKLKGSLYVEREAKFIKARDYLKKKNFFFSFKPTCRT